MTSMSALSGYFMNKNQLLICVLKRFFCIRALPDLQMLPLILLLAGLTPALPALAAPAASMPVPPAAVMMSVKARANVAGFALPANSSKPIIEYRRQYSMLADQDKQPLLQVFADGRVHVHFPAYMKKSGDYQYQLSRAELVALIRKLSSQGVMDFDSAKATREKQLHDQKMRVSTGELHYISDSVETELVVRLQDYQKNASTQKQANFNKQLRWKNLEHDARRYKNNRAIQSAAAGVSELNKMLQHPAMRKMQ